MIERVRFRDSSTLMIGVLAGLNLLLANLAEAAVPAEQVAKLGGDEYTCFGAEKKRQ